MDLIITNILQLRHHFRAEDTTTLMVDLFSFGLYKKLAGVITLLEIRYHSRKLASVVNQELGTHS